MPAARSGPDWTILIAGAALLLTFASGLWGLINPQRDTERMEKRLSAVENDLAWKYVNKELLAKDVDVVKRDLLELKMHKVDKEVYEQKIQGSDKRFEWLLGRVNEMDRSVNQTFNARDAYNNMQTRILELERTLRDKK